MALEKSERVTMGGKDRGEIRSKIGKVTGMVADVPTTEILGTSIPVQFTQQKKRQ